MIWETQDNLESIKDLLLCLVEAIPDAIFLKNDLGQYVLANKAARDFFESHDIDWQDKTDQQLIDECPQISSAMVQLQEDDETAWKAGNLVIFKSRSIKIANSHRDVELRKIPIFSGQGKRKLLVVIAQDVTERKCAEHDLRIADAAIESLEAIVITDASSRILRVNSSFTRLTGYAPQEVIGKTTAILKSGRHDKAFYEAMWQALKERKNWRGEVWDRRKNGEIYPKWLNISAVTGEDGEVQNYIGAFNDLSENKEARDAIHRLAFYDPLTDLPNRRLLRDRLDLALSNCSRNLHYCAILMIDLDNFKRINDTRGHAIGDLLLVEVAQRLKTCVREGDTVARLGGDEFVIMLEYLSKDASQAALQAETVSRKILLAINQDYMIGEQMLHSSLSIGIALFTMPAATSEEMLKRADAAMYQAKAAGRNTLRFFDPDVNASLEKLLSIEAELRQALPKNELVLYYQPQIDHRYQLLGAEVLLRWQHPQRGLVPPDEFIPLAEESGLILPIGLWVLHNTCVQLKKWEENPLTRHLTLAINVSSRQFGQPDFVEQVCKVLEDTGAKATLLKLEITESLVIKDIADSIKKMEALKLLGIRFSIDDFGTGYSSLSYLRRLPISELKIDRSFVQEIDTDPNDAIIAQTIIGMANNLGINVIAEGVETEAQRVRLESYECTSYQGYLFGKPAGLADFEKQAVSNRSRNSQ